MVEMNSSLSDFDENIPKILDVLMQIHTLLAHKAYVSVKKNMFFKYDIHIVIILRTKFDV